MITKHLNFIYFEKKQSYNYTITQFFDHLHRNITIFCWNNRKRTANFPIKRWKKGRIWWV